MISWWWWRGPNLRFGPFLFAFPRGPGKRILGLAQTGITAMLFNFSVHVMIALMLISFVGAQIVGVWGMFLGCDDDTGSQ